ncbi:MAG: UvrD-helicase domain-containing protein [Rickettsiales bacterium]|jgi:DNA helicase-2/ATP-dependent DNA helicase PcrA|nr:UvrD-helicase domain-containing protein [Rickettsiales bacterium]
MQGALDGLNREQQEAVLYNDGPLLLLAGAGTGKTRVLTSKIAHLVETKLSEPFSILAVTFTNRAADELKRRVASMVDVNISGMFIGTFHSISARILREYGERIGLDKNFRIIDNLEQVSLVKQVILEFGLDPQGNSPKHYSEMIGKMKNMRLGVNESPYELQNMREAYDQKLMEINGCDFNDLLLNVLKLFNECTDIVDHYGEMIKYFLVDEYQDTNVVQHQWLKLISGVKKNKNVKLTCVGDDDQSIYGWRGAEIDNMLKFVNDYKKAKVLKLERNYRSTPNILNVASTLIAHNSHRHRKTLYTDESGPNEKVHLVSCNDARQEAIVIAREIGRLRDTGYIGDYGNVAILIRASYQTRALEDVFIRCQLPYRIVGGIKFFERKELRDCIAYLRLANNLNDFTAFERAINSPRRGIGPATMAKIKEFAVSSQVDYPTALSYLCSNGTIRAGIRSRALDFVRLSRKWYDYAKTTSPGDLMLKILEETKLKESFAPDLDSESKMRSENIEELLNTLRDFPTIDGFLDYINLMSYSEYGSSPGEAVNLITIHSAKGLEFDVVFLPNWQEGVFPSPRSLDSEAELEEERRLAYVAVTRAKKKLYISHSRFKYENREIISVAASRFIDELPEENLRIVRCELDSQYYRDYYAHRYVMANKNYTGDSSGAIGNEQFSEYFDSSDFSENIN